MKIAFLGTTHSRSKLNSYNIIPSNTDWHNMAQQDSLHLVHFLAGQQPAEGGHLQLSPHEHGDPSQPLHEHAQQQSPLQDSPHLQAAPHLQSAVGGGERDREEERGERDREEERGEGGRIGKNMNRS